MEGAGETPPGGGEPAHPRLRQAPGGARTRPPDGAQGGGGDEVGDRQTGQSLHVVLLGGHLALDCIKMKNRCCEMHNLLFAS